MSMEVELPISLNYVPAWGLYEALRELFQNALDRNKKAVEDGKPYNIIYKYYPDHKTLLIGNENTNIDNSTLILGNTDKATDKTKIGQYGEGYKLALIVLLRAGYDVKIYNGFQLWEPAITYSKKFSCDILTIYQDGRNHKYHDLVFAIHGLKQKDMEAYKHFNLNLQKPYKADNTSIGELLYNEEHKGRIFVEGLHICDMANGDFYYGYNFKAGVIALDRDRKKLSTVDVAWESKKIFAELTPEDDDKIIELLRKEAKDIEYYIEYGTNTDAIKRIGAQAYATFKDEYGQGYVPVGDYGKEDYLRRIYENVKTKHVPKKLAEAMEASEEYKKDLNKLSQRVYISPEKILKKFVESNKPYFNPVLLERFQDILRRAKGWKGEDYE